MSLVLHGDNFIASFHSLQSLITPPRCWFLYPVIPGGLGMEETPKPTQCQEVFETKFVILLCLSVYF